jgi:hypothetical protein
MPDAGLFYDAYRDLATCRAPDGPIPWRDAMLYADRKGFSPEVANALWTVIRKMDAAERRWHSDELSAKLKKASGE